MNKNIVPVILFFVSIIASSYITMKVIDWHRGPDPDEGITLRISERTACKFPFPGKNCDKCYYQIGKGRRLDGWSLSEPAKKVEIINEDGYLVGTSTQRDADGFFIFKSQPNLFEGKKYYFCVTY